MGTCVLDPFAVVCGWRAADPNLLARVTAADQQVFPHVDSHGAEQVEIESVSTIHIAPCVYGRLCIFHGANHAPDVKPQGKGFRAAA